MKHSVVKAPSVHLEKVCNQFAQWRKTRVERTPIPQDLWDAAMSLVPEHSVCQVSKALHLDYKIFKERVRQRDAQRPLNFIELDVHQLPGECVIEMEHHDGARMRIRFRGGRLPDLLEMARAFWGRP